MESIKISYDGEYPNLCSGKLIVVVGGKSWNFPSHCLQSGGNVWFDEESSEHIDSGPWSIWKWPARFPKRFKVEVLKVINEAIPKGCCGGCV